MQIMNIVQRMTDNFMCQKKLEIYKRSLDLESEKEYRYFLMFIKMGELFFDLAKFKLECGTNDLHKTKVF